MNLDPDADSPAPREARARNTAYLILLVSWASLAFAGLMVVFLLSGRPMTDRESGRAVPTWFELIIVAVIVVVGLALNRLSRWFLNQSRAGRIAFGEDR